MRNRSRHKSNAVERLRLAIDCMPLATREAMLAGVRGNERVIAGAYVDDRGGVCPMLAAHRLGARTDYIAFARSWDRFTRAGRGGRPATERELRILVTQLEDSLSEASGLELDEAIREHRSLRSSRLRAGAAPRRARADAAADTGARTARAKRLRDADPTGEIIARRLRWRGRLGRGRELEDASASGDSRAAFAAR
jgi:hypothetical protein